MSEFDVPNFFHLTHRRRFSVHRTPFDRRWWRAVPAVNMILPHVSKISRLASATNSPTVGRVGYRIGIFYVSEFDISEFEMSTFDVSEFDILSRLAILCRSVSTERASADGGEG